MRDGDNVGRDKYPVTTTSALDLLIHTEGGINRNQQYYNYENNGSIGGLQKIGRKEIFFLRKKRKVPSEAPNKMQH